MLSGICRSLAFIFLFFPFEIAFAQSATVSTVSPSSGVQGATVPITLTGSGFVSSGVRLTVSGTGVIVLNTRATDDSHLSATLVLSGEAGTRAISVETSAGPSNTVPFEIMPSPLDSASQLSVDHLAGSTGGAGYADGIGPAARFVAPGYMWGNEQALYVSASQAIRRIDLGTAQVQTIGGLAFSHLKGIWSDGRFLYVVDSNAGTLSKVDTSSGQITRIAANLRRPDGLWGDGTYLYLSMFYSVMRIEIATGNMTTLAGSENTAAVIDGVGTQAAFGFPTAIWGSAGFLYVVDLNNIREINTATAAVRTIAKITEPILLNAISGGDGALYLAGLSGVAKLDLRTGATTTISTMSLGGPAGLFERSGQLYVADGGNHVIWKINLATSAVNIFAGAIADRSVIDGNGATSRFYNIASVTSDGANLYVGDTSFSTGGILFRKVNLATANVTTLGSQITNPTTRQDYGVGGTWTDGVFLYYSLTTGLGAGGSEIRRINLATGQDAVFAGSFGQSGPTTLTPVDGSATDARFPAASKIWGDGTYLYVLDAVLQFCPFGGGPSSCLYPLAVQTILRRIVIATGDVATIPFPNLLPITGGVSDMWGDGSDLYLAGGNSIVRVTIATGEKTTIGHVDGANSIWGDGQFLYVTSSSRYTLTRLNPNTGDTTVVAGLEGIIGTDDGLGAAGRFQGPQGIWGDGNHIYVGDLYSIRRISPSGSTSNGGSCSFSLEKSGMSVGADGGTGGVNVITAPGCVWTAHSDTNWIFVTQGTGSGTTPLFFSFTGSPIMGTRTGTITVSGQPFTVTQAGQSASTGTFEPQMVRHLSAGFYIAEATLAPGASGGFWGMEALTSSGQTSGGFNLGGGLAANGATPGFGAFFLPTAQTVSATARAPLAPGSNIALRLLDSNRQPITTITGSGTGSSSLQKTLQPGFYIVEITTDSPAPLNYSLALSADFFGGGVDVGGYIGPGITGFGAFYVPVEQDVTIHTFGRATYGSFGAGSLVLTLRDANRNVIQQIGP